MGCWKPLPKTVKSEKDLRAQLCERARETYEFHREGFSHTTTSAEIPKVVYGFVTHRNYFSSSGGFSSSAAQQPPPETR